MKINNLVWVRRVENNQIPKGRCHKGSPKCPKHTNKKHRSVQEVIKAVFIHKSSGNRAEGEKMTAKDDEACAKIPLPTDRVCKAPIHSPGVREI